MKIIRTKIKKALFSLTVIAALVGCEESIEFEVKANFEIEATVTTPSFNGSTVSTFDAESEIDLSEKINELGNVNTLLVTGVTLQLRGYKPANSGLGGTDYSDTPLTGDVTVTLLSNSNNKELFSENINLGTNTDLDGDDITAPVVELSISPTEAKDLIEDNKVKLKISCANGVIKDHEFKINIVVTSESITSSN